VLLDELSYAHADVVRALEDLEKQGGLLVRRTEEGNDWLVLTEVGVQAAGGE
jgi:DNA-binding MarR family transcriptional regulator